MVRAEGCCHCHSRAVGLGRDTRRASGELRLAWALLLESKESFSATVAKNRSFSPWDSSFGVSVGWFLAIRAAWLTGS